MPDQTRPDWAEASARRAAGSSPSMAVHRLRRVGPVRPASPSPASRPPDQSSLPSSTSGVAFATPVANVSDRDRYISAAVTADLFALAGLLGYLVVRPRSRGNGRIVRELIDASRRDPLQRGGPGRALQQRSPGTGRATQVSATHYPNAWSLATELAPDHRAERGCLNAKWRGDLVIRAFTDCPAVRLRDGVFFVGRTADGSRPGEHRNAPRRRVAQHSR